MSSENDYLFGQWLGNTVGTNNGLIILNLEKDRPNIGHFMYLDLNPLLASFRADLKIKEETKEFIKGTIENFYPLSLKNGKTLSGSDQTYHPKNGTFHLKKLPKQLSGSWETDAGTNGQVSFKRSLSESNGQSKLVSWDGFKKEIKQYSNGSYLFRGQSSYKYPLRTSLHRVERYDLVRYMSEDLPGLLHKMGGMGYRYNLDNAFEHGAMLNLIQHHGYPTPLLDWTASPFIAAFFAFYKIEDFKFGVDDQKVRIFIFNSEEWQKENFDTDSLKTPAPTISAKKLEAFNNPRAIPQQAAVTFSNIYDMENFIDWRGEALNKCYLYRLDILASERKNVMAELQYMGITAASMFPGLDGLCRAEKERFLK